MSVYTLSHLSFPIESGLPGFLIPVFTHNGEYAVQYISDDLELSFVPIKRSQDYIDIALTTNFKIRLLEEFAGKVLGEATHAFFDGEIIVVGLESRLVAYMKANLLQLYSRLASSDPYVLAGVYDFLGAQLQAEQIRSAIKSGRRIPKTAPSLTRTAQILSARVYAPTDADEVNTSNQAMLKQVRSFGQKAAERSTTFRARHTDAATA